MGLTSYKMGNSKFGSMSEHMISHYLDMFKKKTNDTLHGEQIALTTFSMIKLQNIVFKSIKAPQLIFENKKNKTITNIFGKEKSVYITNVYNEKKLNKKQIEKINYKLKIKWNKIRTEIDLINLHNKKLIKIFKKNNINHNKYNFSKNFFKRAILFSKYIRNRYTILDLADSAGILKKNINKII